MIITVRGLPENWLFLFMIYNSKNVLKKLCFVEYHFGAIYTKRAKKLPFNPFFFVKLDDITLYKTPKFRYNRMWSRFFIYLFSKVFMFTLLTLFVIMPYNGQYSDLKGRFFDKNMVEFDREHVGMLCWVIRIYLECFQISTSFFFGSVLCQTILMLLKHPNPKDSMNMSSNAGFSVG